MEASKNGGWEGGFGEVCKMETCLEVLLEMCFFVKPPNFGVEAHMKTLTAVAPRKVIHSTLRQGCR
jgi:hypothetical protein